MQAPSMSHPALPRGAFARVAFIAAMLLAAACVIAGGRMAHASERCPAYSDMVAAVREIAAKDPGAFVLEYLSDEARKLLDAINALPPETEDVSDRVLVLVHSEGAVAYAFAMPNGCLTSPGHLTVEQWDKVKGAARADGDI